MSISINIDVPTGAGRQSAIRELEEKLAALPENAWADIWVRHSRYPSMGALVSWENTYLMFYRFECDPGFVSLNPLNDDSDEMVQFELANGQTDDIPLASCYPTDKAKEALLHFARTGKAHDWLHWLNASGDGNASPNDPFVET